MRGRTLPLLLYPVYRGRGQPSGGPAGAEQAGLYSQARPCSRAGLRSEPGWNPLGEALLGRVQWNGSAQNNIVFAYAHGTGVMIDQRDPDKSRRYKMVTKMDQLGTGGLLQVFFLRRPGLVRPIPWPEYNPLRTSTIFLSGTRNELLRALIQNLEDSIHHHSQPLQGFSSLEREPRKCFGEMV